MSLKVALTSKTHFVPNPEDLLLSIILQQDLFSSCSVFWSTSSLRRNDWSSNNRPVKQLWQHKNVNIKSLVILSLLPCLLFSLIKSTRSSPGSGKLISLNTFPHLIFFFLSYLRLPYLFSPSTLRLCSFMYGSEKPATYHRSLERLSYKSRRYTADLTGHRHKDPSVSSSLWLCSSCSCLLYFLLSLFFFPTH